MFSMRFETDARQGLWLWRSLALGLYAGLLALSVLWLTDWGGPHGRQGLAYLAHKQQQAIAGSVVAGLLMWSLRDRLFLMLVRLQARWAARPARLRRVWSVVLAVLAVAVGLALLSAANHKGPGQEKALLADAASSELLRVLVCPFLAWCLYRWQHARLAVAQQMGLAAAGIAVLVLGLVVTKDNGPMLVFAWAAVLLLAGLVRQALPGGRGALFSLLVAVLGSAGLMVLLPHLAPLDRYTAWASPFAARREYLAEITWFVQAAGFWGFGPEQTPWCGYLGAAVGTCRGLPKQAQSDYVLAALAGWGGTPLAVAVVAAISLWLVSLVRLAAAAVRPRHGVDMAGLAASAGAIYAVLLLAQLWVTSLGNVGLIPLTGINFPLLAWARWALLNSTLALALVWPALQASRASANTAHAAAAPLASYWLGVAWVMLRLSVLGVALVAAGLVWRLHLDAPPAMQPQRLDARANADPAYRNNPWLPLPGCVRWTNGQPVAGLPDPHGPHQASVCGEAPTAVALPAHAPLGWAAVRMAHTQPLVPQTPQTPETPEARPTSSLHLPRRQDVTLTLDASAQQHAQAVADCLTARPSAACAGLALPADLATRYAQRHEGAAVRMVAVMTLRLRDGALLAAAEARSECSQAQMANTQPRPAHCPPEAAKLLRREGRLAFQPLRADDMVASTIKPLLAAALLQGPQGSRWLAGGPRQELLTALAESDTAWFIDRLLCFADSAEPPERCTRPAVLAQLVQRMALAQPLDLLAGAPVPATATGTTASAPPSLTVPGLPLPLGTWPLPAGRTAEQALQAARACHARPKPQRWRGCDTEALQTVVAPLWGQGGARSHPLAVAGLYLRLVAAAQGQTHAHLPHLLPQAGAQAPVGLNRLQAQTILEGLRLTPLQGTTRSACQGVLGKAGCTGLGWAMKTGTSLFPQYGLSVQERAQVCAQAHQALRDTAAPGPDLRRLEAHCALYPMKWAVLLEHPEATDARLTVVLTERNWAAHTGQLDAGDDRAPNVAAEAALLLHAGRAVRR